jgi:haloacetate dehalogenase
MVEREPERDVATPVVSGSLMTRSGVSGWAATLTDGWYRGDPKAMGQENYDEWRKAVRNPDVVRAMLEDYRAGLTVDRQHEETDRAAGRRIRPPQLVLWSKRDDREALYGDPLTIWRAWAQDVRGHSIDSGHHMAEEAPEALATSLGDFFSPQ